MNRRAALSEQLAHKPIHLEKFLGPTKLRTESLIFRKQTAINKSIRALHGDFLSAGHSACNRHTLMNGSFTGIAAVHKTFRAMNHNAKVARPAGISHTSMVALKIVPAGVMESLLANPSDLRGAARPLCGNTCMRCFGAWRSCFIHT